MWSTLVCLVCAQLLVEDGTHESQLIVECLQLELAFLSDKSTLAERVSQRLQIEFTLRDAAFLRVYIVLSVVGTAQQKLTLILDLT